jgi:hypothetical protein
MCSLARYKDVLISRHLLLAEGVLHVCVSVSTLLKMLTFCLAYHATIICILLQLCRIYVKEDIVTC